MVMVDRDEAAAIDGETVRFEIPGAGFEAPLLNWFHVSGNISSVPVRERPSARRVVASLKRRRTWESDADFFSG